MNFQGNSLVVIFRSYIGCRAEVARVGKFCLTVHTFVGFVIRKLFERLLAGPAGVLCYVWDVFLNQMATKVNISDFLI